MKKGKKLYEGKAKILYAAPDKGMAIQHFKDDATAFNNLKKSTIESATHSTSDFKRPLCIGKDRICLLCCSTLTKEPGRYPKYFAHGCK